MFRLSAAIDAFILNKQTETEIINYLLLFCYLGQKNDSFESSCVLYGINRNNFFNQLLIKTVPEHATVLFL